MTQIKVTQSDITAGSEWMLRELPRTGVPAVMRLIDLPAQVPGCVHLDLIRSGIIDDPFRNLNEKSCAWIDETDWEYSTVFAVAELTPGVSLLRFECLDTIAEIVLNGEPLGQCDNMHRTYELDVTGRLRTGEGEAGENQLSITLRSASRVGRERQTAWDAAGNPTLPEHWDNWTARSFVRKAQYMFGWDWGPILPSCGIQKPVKLVSIPIARIGSWRHDVTFNTDGSASVIVKVEVERMAGHENTPLTLGFIQNKKQGFEHIEHAIRTHAVAVPDGVSIAQVTLSLPIDNANRWWPNGYGEQSMVTIVTALSADGVDIDTVGKRIGLRTIELIQTPDPDGNGRGFNFRVNGVDIFAKGANWIPADSFPTRSLAVDRNSESGANEVARLVKKAAQAGMNMLRVWGGGFYESEAFYNACDEHGILVWQDFPYGCAYYPDDDAFCEVARLEATENVRRIRHHASLALWCGNNENQMLYYDNWTGTRPPRFLGERLYDDVLPAVVANEDAVTPYWPGSPYGSGAAGENPNGPDFGDRHNWDVWHGIGDWTNYAKDRSRFVSEFGFASSCGMEAWEKYVNDSQRSPYSPAVRWHDKTRKGYETYLGLVQLHYPRPQSLEDLVYYTQINQADALKFGIEHYRRLKGRCWGTLFWQINDCWPVQSWSVIDYLGEPKAAYWAMRKFYAPRLVSLVRKGLTVEVHAASDSTAPTYGTLCVTLSHFDGSVLARRDSDVELGANTSVLLETFDIGGATDMERETVVRAVLKTGDGATIENVLLLAEPKDLRIADPSVRWRFEKCGSGTMLHMTADRFAPYVWLRRRDGQSVMHVEDGADNFFHLFPAETRSIKLTGSAESLKDQLIVRWL